MRIFYSGVEVLRGWEVEPTLATVDAMMTYHDLQRGNNHRFGLLFGSRGGDLRIYYSGEGSRSNPEITLGDKAQLMLTYHDMAEQNKPTRRFQAILNEVDKPKRKKHKGLSQAQADNYETADIPVGIPQSHFLDSGSFTLWTKAEEYAKENQCGEWEFYDTDQFWEYMDKYVDFCTTHAKGIDHMANVDVLPFRGKRTPPKGFDNASLSYRNLKYLEKKGLHPVPVVHYSPVVDFKWLRRYMEEGYTFIGLGGLVGSTATAECKSWLSQAFDVVCGSKDNTPLVDIHGFGVTSYSLLLRYPWYSVDSTSWTKVGAYGGILVPHKRGGKFTFDEQPYLIKVSEDSPERKQHGKHLLTISKREQAIVNEWLELIDVPMGEVGDEETFGVVTRHTERRVANLKFFEMMRRSVKQYPWAYRSKKRNTFKDLI